MPVGALIFGGIFLVAILCLVIGCCVEQTKCGDDRRMVPSDDVSALVEAAKYRRLEQYDAILLQRKKPFFQRLLAFSWLRNAIYMNMHPRQLRTAINEEKERKELKQNSKISSNMKVFNGMKGAATILMVWGFTFYFVEFTVINNPTQVDAMKQSIGFNVVTGCLFIIPMYFFCSGFLQTFAFMQRDQEESMFTAGALTKYYFRKIFRYMPLNVAAMLFFVYCMPFLGSGPIWNNFKTMTSQCDTYWWTNVLWINNLYPAAFDDKCLPWTWFVPCYIQLSLTVPIILGIY
mmetsp:Transcript_22992/g.35519  ORF Transcript_22992/g.35519 Transcript_22992/m.35519 type:complete len:290 (+) Transcript_22992:557-1426(+)